MSASAPAKAGASWFVLFSIAWLLIWTVQLTPLQLLLPLQLDTSESEAGWVSGVISSGLVLGVGGLAGVIAGPIAGALSDRRNPGTSRRRPFALVGTWITALCLLFTGFSSTPLSIGIAWVGVSIGIAIASAAFTAMIADQLPIHQRGAAASAASSAQAVGIVVGVGTVVLLGLGVFDGYLTLAIAMGVLGTIVVVLLPDPPMIATGERLAAAPGNAPTAPGASATQARSPRFSFLRDHDFRWMLIGRLVVNIGNALGTSLLLFFLLYGLEIPKDQAEDSLLLLIVVYTVFVVAASIVSGVISDKIGRRRWITVAAALVQAVSGVVIVSSPSYGTTMFAAALMGIGYGAFMTVGLAFATDLLPSKKDHARDLGVVNVVAALGQLLGPVIGAGLVAFVGGFWLLFVAAAVLSVLGGALTLLARERNAFQMSPATND